MTRPRVHLGGVTFRPGGGGISRVARLVALALADERREGHLDATVLSLEDRVAPHDLDLPLTCVGGSRLRFVWRARLAAARHSHFFYDFAGTARAQSVLELRRKPCLVWYFGIDAWEDARPGHLSAMRRADLLLVPTEYSRARAGAAHPGLERARVCALGTEHDFAPTSAPRERPIVLMVGRFDGGAKGHDALVDCWPAVVSAVPDARLVLVGEGPDLARMRQKAAASGAGPTIVMPGFVSDGGLEGLWAESAVFAMPSRKEGFGLVYVEAMRHGLPVVASIHDAAPEVNVDGETGYNVDLSRKGDLAERLVHLLRDPDAARRMGENGLARWRQHYRYSVFKQRFLELVKDFLAS